MATPLTPFEVVNNTDHEYLGDGVYASRDPRSSAVWLDLRGQDSVTSICLDPEVLDNLIKYGSRANSGSGATTNEETANDEP
jgi:hypothetical protein